MYEYKYLDCYISFSGDKLIIGNSTIERSWMFEGNGIKPVSLYDKASCTEWLADSSTVRMDGLNTFQNSFLLSSKDEILNIEVSSTKDNDYNVGQEHLKGIIYIKYTNCEIKWDLIIYPNLPVIRSRFGVKGEPCNSQEQEQYTYEEFLMQKDKTPGENDYIDYLPVKNLHCKWKSVAFKAISDYNNNPVSEDHGLLYPSERNWLKGNLLFVTESVGHGGFILIKESPTPVEQVNYYRGDFYLKGKSILVTGSGIRREDLSTEKFISVYGSSVCLWNGKEEDALKVLRDYHNARHQFNHELDCMVIANTWGDRSEDRKLSEEFVLSELNIAKEIGISHYQIDLGWALKSGNPNGNKYIWSVNKDKFPDELYSIKKAAREFGIKTGIWFRPYSANNFETWEEDAQTLIDLYKRFGFTQFKLDGFKIESLKGEENLIKMMQKVISLTENKVSFNIDITANKRLGFFGQTQYGTLFLENRYTDWKNYYPHFTLRNLWKLSKYVPTYRLLMEFLNVDRCCENYMDDPLAPGACGLEYSFAVTMFSNPLAWFETTGLSEESKAVLKELLPKYRQHQQKIISGLVLPIGDEPDGMSWTGFQSIKDDFEGYLLIIRENSMENSHSYKLWGSSFSDHSSEICFHKILGEGEDDIMASSEGIAEFKLKNAFSFGLYKYSVKQIEK